MTRNDDTRSAGKRRLHIVLPVAAALSLLAAGALAFGGPHGGGHRGRGHERMVEHVLEAAGADEAQREQIQEILGEVHRESRAERRERRVALYARVLEILAAEPVDAAALEALRLEHQAEMNAKMEQMTQALVAAANVLTPEQRAAAAEAMESHFEGRSMRRWGRHGGWGRDHGYEAADDRG